jgi:serine/threonine protein kinase
MEEKHYNHKVDIFAIGLILYEMCACFKTGMERMDCFAKLRNEHKIKEHIIENFPEESQLILSMTNKFPESRPTAQGILNSEAYEILKTKYDKEVYNSEDI